MLNICNPPFLLNVKPHLSLTAILEERSYESYLEETEELVDSKWTPFWS